MSYKSLVQVIKEHNVGKDLSEKFSPYNDKQYPRCVDFYIQFRGGKGDRITSPENKKDFEKATKMIDAYCRTNKIKQKPVYSTPEEGSSAYKVGLMIDKTYSKTDDYDKGVDLQPLYVALSKLKTAEDHGGGWSQAVVKEDLDEGVITEARIPMYKKTKFEGKEFDKKKEIKSLLTMQKAIHKVAKMQDSMQYTAETGGTSTSGNPNAIYQGLVDAERAIFAYMGGIERGNFDGVIDMDRD